MSDPIPPATRLQQALAAGNLEIAERAAGELSELPLEDSLGILLLLRDERDARFTRSAVRWLGRVLVAKPQLGLEFAADLADALAELDGASPNVARGRIAVLLRSVGLTEPAAVVERHGRTS